MDQGRLGALQILLWTAHSRNYVPASSTKSTQGCNGSPTMTTSRMNVFFFLPLVLAIGLWAQTTGTLSGTVNNAEGAPVANAAVTVTPAGGGAPQKVTTGADGKFT